MLPADALVPFQYENEPFHATFHGDSVSAMPSSSQADRCIGTVPAQTPSPASSAATGPAC